MKRKRKKGKWLNGQRKSTKVLPLPTFPTTWLLFPSQTILHCQSGFEWRHKTKHRRFTPNSPGKKKRRRTRGIDKDWGRIKTQERASQRWQAAEQQKRDDGSVKQTLIQYSNKTFYNAFSNGSIMRFHHALTDWQSTDWDFLQQMTVLDEISTSVFGCWIF